MSMNSIVSSQNIVISVLTSLRDNPETYFESRMFTPSINCLA